MKHLLHKLNSLRLLTLLTLLLGVGGSQVWADTYKLVESSSELSVGDVILITNAETGSAYALGATQNTNNRSAASVEITDKIISSLGLAQEITLSASSGSNFAFKVGESSYLYAASSSANHLKSKSAASYWKIDINSTTFVATIKDNTNTKNHNNLRYNANNGDPIFSCYTYADNNLYVFKKQATPTAEISMITTNVNLAVGATNTRTASSSTTGATISYSSSNSSIVSVNSSTGEVTAVSEGSATITATASADGYLDATSSYIVNVSDAREAVNLIGFSATSTTLVKGSTTITSVENDQPGWTAAYSYSSSNTDVATVDEEGVITAVAKGTSTITCSLYVNPSDATYKAGTTKSKTIVITVNNPSHTVTFSSNGSTYGETASVEEGGIIKLPAVNPSVDGKSFRGWVTTPIAGTTNNTPDFVTSPVMGTSNVTYYAVFADEVAGGEVTTTKTITPSTDNLPTSYGTANTFTEYTLEGVKFKVQQMYINGAKLQWRAAGNSSGTGTMYNIDALGKLQSIVLTYDESDSNKNFTVYVGDSENPTSGTSIKPTNEGFVYTYDCSAYNEDYFVLTNGSNAGYLTSIAITYKAVGPTTYENYCTTVSNLPLAVVTLSTNAIEMTWGESGKTLTATATVDDKTIAEPITFTPSSPDLTIDGSGNISCNVPGNYTITASVAETDEHQAGQAICSVTVNKKDIELTFENPEVITIDEELGYTQTATATPETGAITYAITSSSSENAEIDENTGELTFINTGVIEVTATAPATTLYNGNTATYTLYVKTTPTITVSNQSVAYGSTFTVDKNAITGGDITVTSGSTTIATVDGLTITPVAVGSTTITVATAESDTYVAGEETFTLTVTAPEASSTNTAKEPIFYESFDESTGTAGWSGSAGNGTANFDNDGWTKEDGVYGGDKCIKLASGNNSGSITTPSITTTAGTTYTLTFKAGSWAGKSSTLSLSATGATTILSPNNISLDNETFNDYEATFTAQGSSVTLTFSATKNYQLFLDEIKITKPITSTSVTTTGGLATYCYQYPLDLDGISGAKAYVVKDVDMEKRKVMLTQITGTIKGGVPFILKADGDDATFEIPLADESETVPDGNLLVGTLAPTFVAQTSGDYTNFAYSKSNECFVKLGDAGNTVPANRAYLPINLGDAGVKSFALTFDNADGIARTQIEGGEERVYNLAGQRLQKAQRGVNIINGRKVLVK